MKRSTCMKLVASVTLALGLAGCETAPTTSPIVRPDADSLAMSPDLTSVQVGSAFRFTVEAFDSLGARISANLTFTSSDPAVFTVDGTGRVLGEGEGVGTLIVASGAARDSAVVTVTPAERGWFAQVSGATGVALRGVFFRPSGREGWAVGDLGRILRTLDGGAAWSSVTSGTSFALNGVWFTSDLEGWVVGGSGTVLRTTNGGTSWTRLSVPAAENLNDVQFATRDTGCVVGANGVILRTFDRGSSWQRLAPTPFDLHSVSFSGTREGWAVGDNGVILGTHDRGRSWYTYQPAVTGLALRGVWRVSTARANAAGAAGVAPRTIASADTAAWQIDNAGAAFDLYGVCFPNASVGFAVGFNAGGAILRSDNGGASWLPQVSNAGFRLEDVFFVDAQRGWAVGANGTIVHTVTGGQP